MQTTIDRSGRVLIPKAVRDELHLTPGTALRVEQRNGAVVFSPTWEEAASSEEQPLKRKGGLLVFAGKPVGDLTEAVAEQRRRRIRQTAAWRSE